MARTRTRNSAPASVSDTLRVVWESSLTPSRSSSECRRRDRMVGSRPIRTAALVKERASATAANAAISASAAGSWDCCILRNT